ELDIEDVLRTALEYLLTKTAPTNAAVFLPDADHRYGLAAYVNYDCPRESVTVLLDHLALVVCPHMAQEPEIIAFSDTDEFADWIGPEMGFLAGCEVVAFSCRNNGECLAVVVLFRSRNAPFEEELAPILDILRQLFAEQLAHVLKIHHRAMPQWPADAADDPCEREDDFGFGPMAA
ncbi:MAG: GAF domain-containing protein, partial [Planctomycetota bacterium]